MFYVLNTFTYEVRVLTPENRVPLLVFYGFLRLISGCLRGLLDCLGRRGLCGLSSSFGCLWLSSSTN